MQNKRNLIFLTGAAATGKTSVLDVLKNMYSEKGQEIYTQTSITRDLYAKLNIALSEKEIQLLPENEKIEFQLKLLNGYIDYTLSKLNSIVTDAVIDRFIVDYLGWTLFVGPSLSKSQYYKIIDRMTYFIDELKLSYNINICYFPFPTPWTMDKKDNSSDGFRYDPFGKNLTISYILKAEVDKLSVTDLDIVSVDIDFGSPEERAKQIWDLFVNKTNEEVI